MAISEMVDNHNVNEWPLMTSPNAESKSILSNVLKLKLILSPAL